MKQKEVRAMPRDYTVTKRKICTPGGEMEILIL